MKIINQDGETQIWVAVYMRHYCEYRAECDSLDHALGLLYWGLDDGQLSPSSIVEPSGNVIEGEELDEALENYYNERQSHQER